MDHEERIGVGRILLGPWPFAPLAIFILGAMGGISRAVIISGNSTREVGPYVLMIVEWVLIGGFVAIMAILPMLAVLRWGPPRMPSRGQYLGVIAIGALVASIAQIASRMLSRDAVIGRGVYEDIPFAFVVTFVLILVFAVAVSNAAGYYNHRIGRQTRLLEEQVRQLEQQRRLVVEADQRVRADVARALHDDIQGALLRAVLRLNRMVDGSPPGEADALRAVVADLERLRGEGVRSISRRLAPPIESTGISSALEDLVEAYRGSIAVTVDIDDRARDTLSGWRDGQFAAYRIVEQALLNAAAHGRASSAEVTIRGEDGGVALRIRDDGAGLTDAITPGMGLAVVDAWVGIMGGTWHLEPGASAGADLRATLLTLDAA